MNTEGIGSLVTILSFVCFLIYALSLWINAALQLNVLDLYHFMLYSNEVVPVIRVLILNTRWNSNARKGHLTI